MNLMEIFQRLWDEDKWREQQAQKLSSGLGSLPYSFDQQMEQRAPLLLNAFRQQDINADKSNKMFQDNLAPDYAPQRYYLNEGIKMRQKGLEDIYKGGM